MAKPVRFSGTPKTPKADTSFDFGANVAKPRKSKGGKKGGKPGGGS